MAGDVKDGAELTTVKAGTVASQTVDVVAKDQYGDDMKLSDLTATCYKPDETEIDPATNRKSLNIHTGGNETNKVDYK